jgi:hypothetical protein
VPLSQQIVWLLLLALPVASVAWTVTHEEVLHEPREFCIRKSREGRSPLLRKFFYVFTCEYCFSHYIALFFMLVARYKLLFTDWRGYLMAWFALVWVANLYMSVFARLRLDIKRERVEIKGAEQEVERKTGGKKAA